jgi:hypothetical protein
MGAFEDQVHVQGDRDFSGVVDMDDIDALVMAFRDAAAYEVQYGVRPATNGDTDGDGDLYSDDIPGCVELLGPHPLNSGTNSGANMDQVPIDPSLPKVGLSRRSGKAEGSDVDGISAIHRSLAPMQSEAVWAGELGWLGRRKRLGWHDGSAH